MSDSENEQQSDMEDASDRDEGECRSPQASLCIISTSINFFKTLGFWRSLGIQGGV
jgi:hypothetical protein